MALSQSSPPPGFNRSPLVQLLASLQIPNAAESAQTFAEQLSHWVAWKDAIGLSSALDSRPAAGLSVEPLGDVAIAKAIEQVRQVREALASAIARDGLLVDGVSVTTPPLSTVITTNDESPTMDFASYRHCYMTHQRVMDERIGRLRADVRATVAGVSSALGRLAALDAAMEQALAAHQRRVLGQLPALLEKHFKRQQRSGAQPLAATQGRAAPGQHGPLSNVGLVVQQALLGELTLRLQPVTGMVAALSANAAAHL